MKLSVTLSIDPALLKELQAQTKAIESIASSLTSLAESVKLIREEEFGGVPSDSTGISVTQDPASGT